MTCCRGTCVMTDAFDRSPPTNVAVQLGADWLRDDDSEPRLGPCLASLAFSQRKQSSRALSSWPPPGSPSAVPARQLTVSYTCALSSWPPSDFLRAVTTPVANYAESSLSESSTASTRTIGIVAPAYMFILLHNYCCCAFSMQSPWIKPFDL